MKPIHLMLTHNLIPVRKVYIFRCMNTPCNRPLFKYTADDLVISNFGPLGYESHPPGSKYIEIKCHSCGKEYKVLFQ